jgi:hypothetical protein
MGSVRAGLAWLFILGSVVAGAGCYHIKGGAIPNPSGGPTTSPTITPLPGSCGTLQTSTTQIIDVSPGIVPTHNPTFGNMQGYGLDPGTGFPAQTAGPVNLRPADLIQFVNVDVTISDSAVGFGTTKFPAYPYTFPPGTQNPIGKAIGSSQWSTGRIQPVNSLGTFCYSQQFTLPSSGTVAYFGDFDNFNLTFGSFRGVIVVSNSAPQSHRRRRP